MTDFEYDIKLNKLREVGKHVTECFDLLKIEPGMTTKNIELQVKTYQDKHNLQNAQYGYQPKNGYHYQPPFPSYCCTSVNEAMCHGVPTETILKDGDIVSVDITFIKDGFYGDACRTFLVGDVPAKTRIFVELAKEATALGVAQALPGKTLRDIGQTIEAFCKKHKIYVSKDFVGHGISNKMHDWPSVFHYNEKNNNILDMVLQPGLCICIEPIICQGKPKFITGKDGWTITTKDKSLSAQYETQVFITQTGQEIISK